MSKMTPSQRHLSTLGQQNANVGLMNDCYLICVDEHYHPWNMLVLNQFNTNDAAIGILFADDRDYSSFIMLMA